MKKPSCRFLMGLLLFFCFGSSCRADDGSMVKAFYTEYGNAVQENDSVYYTGRCDSLVTQYCTSGFAYKIRDEFENGIGYDWLTDNYGMDSLSVSTLSVTTASGYCIVKFKVHTGFPVVNKVSDVELHVYMEGHKITDVVNPDN